MGKAGTMNMISGFAGLDGVSVSHGEILKRISGAETVRTAGLAETLVWYVLCVPAAREAAAERILRDLGFNVLLPIEYKLRRRTRYCGERVPVPYPLMSRYLLIGFDEAPPWLDILKHRVVDGVVGDANGPKRLTIESVRHVLRLHQGDSVSTTRALRLMRTRQEFTVGDAVRVVDHAYDGWVGNVVKLRGSKARVLLQFFNSETAVEIPLDNLQPDR